MGRQWKGWGGEYPPGLVREEQGGVGGVEGAGRVLRAALQGSVVGQAMEQLLPKLGIRWDEVKRQLDEAEEEQQVGAGEEKEWTKDGQMERDEEDRWRRYRQAEEQAMQQLRLKVTGPSSAGGVSV